jgi:hypothetical protein
MMDKAIKVLFGFGVGVGLILLGCVLIGYNVLVPSIFMLTGTILLVVTLRFFIKTEKKVVLLSIITLFLFFGMGIAIIAIPEYSSSPRETIYSSDEVSSRTDNSPLTVSSSEYSRLQLGMTPKEVSEVIGSLSGKIVFNDSWLVKSTGKMTRVVEYEYKGEKGIVGYHLMFEDGLLEDKYTVSFLSK